MCVGLGRILLLRFLLPLVALSQPVIAQVGAPTDVSAAAGNAQVKVSWKTGSPISQTSEFILYYAPGNVTINESTLASITGLEQVTAIPRDADESQEKIVTNLTNGEIYSFAVRANANTNQNFKFSETVTATPNTPPAITSGPAHASVIEPAKATFSVTATGSPTLAYQWYKNNAVISGANSSSYTTPATTLSDGGTQFSVVVSNGIGRDSSTAATLTVSKFNNPPKADAGPDQSITLPSKANLDGSASTDQEGDTLTYAWSKAGGPGTVTFGTAGSAKTTADFSLDGSYSLRLVVSDGAKQDTDLVTVTVKPAPVPPAKPTASPGGGIYTEALNVTLSSPEAGLEIRYSTGQTNPTPTSGQIYSGPISLASSATIRAITIREGIASDALILEYAINISTNTPPTVSLTSPSDGDTSFLAPASITLTASASDLDGSITAVVFRQGATLLATVQAPNAFTYAWKSVGAGTYSLTAEATDDKGAKTISSPITVTVKQPPNAPPVVSISQPHNGATFSTDAAVKVIAKAADDGGIEKVDFYVDNRYTSTQRVAPYTFFPKTSIAGTFSLKARAFDNSGLSVYSEPISIQVIKPNQPPVISWSAPAEGASFISPATIDISVGAIDNDGAISKVRFFQNDKILGDVNAPQSGNIFTYSWSNVSAGSYTLKAVAYDNEGDSAVTAPPRSITVNSPGNKSPTVAIAKPLNNTKFVAPGQITLEASASDPDGTVNTVRYFYGGTNQIGQSSGSPFSVSWPQVSAGTYTLTARATDNGGNSTLSSPLSISVTLPPPAGIEASPGNASATLRWNTVTGATSYNLAYNPGASVGASPIVLPTAGDTSYTVNNLANGQQYAFHVTTEGPGGTSPPSVVVTATPNPHSPPAQPGNLVATAQDGSVHLTWNASGGADHYNVYYAQGNTVDRNTLTKLTGINVTSATIEGLINENLYAFSVAANNTIGESPLSTIKTAMPAGSPPIISAISPATATIRVGEPHKITVTVSEGTSPLNFAWTRNGSVISGATDNVISLPDPQLEDAGNYSVTVSNALGETKASSHLIVNQRKVAIPHATPTGQAYTQPLTVGLHSNTPQTVIRYTLNGSEPDEQSKIYDSAAKIIFDRQSVTLKVKGFRAGYISSNLRVETYSYIESGRVVTPKAEPFDSTFTGSGAITLSTLTSGADIHYTTDGSIPTTASPKYATALQINRTATVKAIAVKSGMQPSPMLEKTYTIIARSEAALKPEADPTGRNFNESIVVRLSTESPGSQILYALNDSVAESGTWPVYSVPLTLKSTTLLRAKTRKSGLLDSDILEEEYVQLPTTPTSLPRGDSVFSGFISVELQATPVGAAIYYTLDGSNPLGSNRQPSSTSERYRHGFPILITSSRSLNAVAFLNGHASKDILTNFYLKDGEPLPSPSANPSATPFSDTLSILLRGPSGSAIHYTLNGSIPNSSSPKYLGIPLVITGSATLQAITVKGGFPNSKIMVERYVFVPADLVANPTGGNYVTGVTVNLSSPTSGAKIFYTTDGRSPLSTSAIPYDFAKGIKLTANATIKAYAALGGEAGKVLTETYTITPAGDTLLFPGETYFLPGNYAVSNPLDSRDPVLAKLLSGESVDINGFSDKRFGLNLTASASDVSFPRLDFRGPPGGKHLLYRHNEDGRVHFISRGDDGVISEAGLHVLAVDDVAPKLVLLEQKFDGSDSTLVRLRFIDNVANLSFDFKRNDDTLASHKGWSILDDDVVEFKVKHADGTLKPLLIQVIANDSRHRGYFPKTPATRFGVSQKLRNVKSPKVVKLASPNAASSWDLVGFPFASASKMSSSWLQSHHNGIRFTAAENETHLGPDESLQSGRGYWMNASKGLENFSFKTLETLPFVTDSLTVTLSPGWNQVSNPYMNTLHWPHSRQFPDAYGVSLIKGLYHWSPTSAAYAHSDSLEPWRGYFVYSNSTRDSIVKLLPRPAEPPLVLRKQTGAEGLDIWLQLQEQAPLWLGASASADNEVGVEDEFPLPKRGTRASAYALRGTTALQTDRVRLKRDELLRWSLVLAGWSNGDSLPTLRVIKSALPPGYEAWAFSRVRNLKFPLTQGNEISVPGDISDTLDVVAGPREKVAGLGDFKNFSPLENFGLTVHPMHGDFHVRLEIPGQSRVRLSVWDIRGRRLGLLQAGRLAEGRYRFSFSADFGRGSGSHLASGLYFLLAEINGSEENHRLVKRLPIR